MLAIDTNLIVRYLVGDDPGQAARARRLIDNNDVFVCTTVLLETEWVLRSVYGFSAAQCAKALSDFAGLPGVSLEDATAE
jgi:predicted nucleic acid-binding protein